MWFCVWEKMIVMEQKAAASKGPRINLSDPCLCCFSREGADLPVPCVLAYFGSFLFFLALQSSTAFGDFLFWTFGTFWPLIDLRRSSPCSDDGI